MKTKVYFGVLIGCLVATGEAAAGNFCEAERIHTRGEGAGLSADFSSVDTTTCALGVETTVHVDASGNALHVVDICGGGGTSSGTVTDSDTNVVNVVIGAYDRCLDMAVLSVTGTGVADELHVHPNSKTGSLRATFEGTDEFNQPVSLAVDLVWDGVGRKDRSRDHVNLNEGIFRLIYNAYGSIRDAGAAGSVSIDSIDKTPLPSTHGTIEKKAARSLEVYR